MASLSSGERDVMTNHDCIEELAGLLDLGRQEAGSLLSALSSAMVAELLAARKLSLKGLGSFTVTHIPSVKKSTASTIVYTPPRNELTFTSRMSGSDDSVRLAVSRLSMNPADAEKFGRSLSLLFSGAVHQQREIRLNGIGRFALEQGTYVFFPERSLEELLNREYQDLKEVVLPQSHQEHGKGENTKRRYVLPLLIVTISVLLVVVLNSRFITSFFVREGQPERVSGSPVQKVKETFSRLPARVLYPERAAAGATDSVVFEKNDYTIVLASFRKEPKIRQEQLRLTEKGVMAFVWPPDMPETKYYRLMTGRFASRNAAAERIRQLPQQTAGNSYIHQVIERVVLHGEKGM